MGLEEYIPRPTVPQIRNGKQEVMYKPGNDLTQVESLSGDSQFMRIADQVLPDSLFPSAEDILYRNHSWDRTGVSRSFMKKSKFVQAFVGRTQEDISRRVKQCGDQELLDIFYNRLSSSKLSPGMSFRPIVTPNKAERIVYWDQLCAGALIYKSGASHGMRVTVYDDAKSVSELGAHARVDFIAGGSDKKEGLVISHIPVKEDRAHVLARAIYSNRQTDKTDFSVMSYSSKPLMDAGERKELDALVVAGWFGVCASYADTGNDIPANTSVIPFPSDKLLDLYMKLKNNVIIQVPQSERDSRNKKGVFKEHRLNQAEINVLLSRQISSEPAKYLLSLDEVL